MIHPRVDELLENVDSRYALVIVGAKRARQINNYHHQLGEGTFDDFPPPLVPDPVDLRAERAGALAPREADVLEEVPGREAPVELLVAQEPVVAAVLLAGTLGARRRGDGELEAVDAVDEQLREGALAFSRRPGEDEDGARISD